MKQFLFFLVAAAAVLMVSCDVADSSQYVKDDPAGTADTGDTTDNAQPTDTGQPTDNGQPIDNEPTDTGEQPDDEIPDNNQSTDTEEPTDTSEPVDNEIPDDGGEPPLTDPTCGTNQGEIGNAALIPMAADTTIGDAPTPRYVHLSWQSEPAISMTFTWTTLDSSAGTMTKMTYAKACTDEAMTQNCVETGPGNTGSMKGAAWVLPYDNARKTVHVAELCGLKPGTTYYYQVGAPDHLSPVSRFRTAPDPRHPAPPFTFVAMGDSRGAPERLARTIRAAVENEDPVLISFGGDWVSDGTRQNEWSAVFEQAEEWMRSVPILSVIGNHESNAVNYFAQFAMPGNENWFAIRWGNAVFVNLTDCFNGAGLWGTYGTACTGALMKPESIKNDQTQFMHQIFGAVHADTIWRFVTHHRPIYSETTDLTHGGSFNTDLKTVWAPVFDQYKVTMVFNGHDHYYQRSVPLKADQKQASELDGVNYIVTAGAGATLYDVKTTDKVKVTKAAIHYVAIDIDGNSLSFRAVELNPDTGAAMGNIDSFQIQK